MSARSRCGSWTRGRLQHLLAETGDLKKGTRDTERRVIIATSPVLGICDAEPFTDSSVALSGEAPGWNQSSRADEQQLPCFVHVDVVEVAAQKAIDENVVLAAEF